MANFILPTEEIEKLKPGFYENVESRRYARLKAETPEGKVYNAINASVIKSLYPYKSWAIPAYARYAMETPREDTAALSFGRICHLALFEREEFDKLIVKPEFEVKTAKGDVPKNPKATTAYKQMESEWLKANEGKDIVEKTDYEAALAAVKQCKESPKVNALLERASYNELTGVSTDAETGLVQKIRIDRFITIDGRPAILDAKTTGQMFGALPDLFRQSIYEYKYHIQKAFYAKVVKEIMGLDEYPDSIIIVIETKGARLVNAQYLDKDWITGGMKLVEKALRVFKKCIDTGEWPGYPQMILQNAPLPYYFKDDQQLEPV